MLAATPFLADYVAHARPAASGLVGTMWGLSRNSSAVNAVWREFGSVLGVVTRTDQLPGFCTYSHAGHEQTQIELSTRRRLPADVPHFRDFLQSTSNVASLEGYGPAPHAAAGTSAPTSVGTGSKAVFIETYGCQMNVSDSEVVLSILSESGYRMTDTATSADVILVNTCAIRENAETRIWGRLGQFQHYKKLRRLECR